MPSPPVTSPRGRGSPGTASTVASAFPKDDGTRAEAHLAVGDTRELGPLFESLGDTAAAMEQYQGVVDAWGDGDPELQRAVQHARAHIAALGG